MPAPEFSRPVRIRPLPGDAMHIEASDAERTALAQRFGLPNITSLTAMVELEHDGKAIRASGNLDAEIIQACAISGEDFTTTISEPLALRFVEEGSIDPALSEDEDIEIELSADELDEIEYSGDSFDLGEAIAQSLGLAIDPYAEGPNADAARNKAGITSDEEQAPSGPLAEALKALKKD